MNYETQAITIELNLCRACGRQLLASQNYCRLCGASQQRLPPPVTMLYGEQRGPSAQTRQSLPATGAPSDGYRLISGAVLSSFVTSELTASPARMKSQTARRAVAAAITLPLWLMIILLSPLDALAASRQVAKQL